MVPRRSIVSTAISAALHGAALAIALWMFSGPPSHAPSFRPPEVAAFDVVVAPPPPPPLPDRPPPPRAGHAPPAPAGARALSVAGHRGHDAPRSALLPSALHDGELTISVDTPIGPDADGQGTEHGLGSSGLGTGPDGPGTGTALAIPDPPHPSAARPPRPRYDYSEVTIHGSRIYTGKQIKLLLTIDAHGVVRGVRILQSVERHFDLRAIRKALQFEFDPALDPNGQPTTATLPWTFVVTL